MLCPVEFQIFQLGSYFDSIFYHDAVGNFVEILEPSLMLLHVIALVHESSVPALGSWILFLVMDFVAILELDPLEWSCCDGIFFHNFGELQCCHVAILVAVVAGDFFECSRILLLI